MRWVWDGHAKADRETPGKATVLVECREISPHPVENDLHPFRVDLGHHDDEFIASNPRHDVGPSEGSLQKARQFLQGAIALFMSEGIVDALEVIDIDKDKAECRPLAVGEAALMFGQ